MKQCYVAKEGPRFFHALRHEPEAPTNGNLVTTSFAFLSTPKNTMFTKHGGDPSHVMPGRENI